MNSPLRLRLGTRASALARWQAEWVAARLGEHGVDVELVPISTQGDRQQVGAIGTLGASGVFTKELQRALLDGDIDLAVHSLKDLPTDVVGGLALSSVPARGPVGDVLVSRGGILFADLPQGAKVGTGSLRRRAQLKHARIDLVMEDVRGNVDTRLRKLHEGQYDALVLAEAGLKRLGFEEEITEVLPKSLMLPAVGQGALGIETRSDDETTRTAVGLLNDPATHAAVLAERFMLAALLGGCLAPVGGWGRVEPDGRLHLEGVVIGADGQKRIMAARAGNLAFPEALGHQVAQDLLSQGAGELIQQSRAT
jgi:hydroxymethylbilane synthase